MSKKHKSAKARKPRASEKPSPEAETPVKKSVHKKHPRTVLFLGVDETDRDSLLELVLKVNKKYLPRLTLVKIPRFPESSGLKEITESMKSFYKRFDRLLDVEGNRIITASTTTHTEAGFVPTFPQGFFERISPDFTILLETDARKPLPEYGIVRRKTDPTGAAFQQHISRYYAAHTGAPLKVIIVQKDNIKRTLKEIRELLMFAFR